MEIKKSNQICRDLYDCRLRLTTRTRHTVLHTMEFALSDSSEDSDDMLGSPRSSAAPAAAAAASSSTPAAAALDAELLDDSDEWEYEEQGANEGLARAARATTYDSSSGSSASPRSPRSSEGSATAQAESGGQEDQHLLFQAYLTHKVGTRAFPALIGHKGVTTVVTLAEHPSPLVEPSSLSAVIGPDPTYIPDLPLAIFEATPPRLSAAQFETVVYAGQRHEQKIPGTDVRCGYFLGDGTGVGKGRQCAAMLFDSWRQGRRRSVWVSVSNDLFHDAQRDFADIFALDEVNCFQLRNVAGGKKIRGDGIAFCTYALLIQAKNRKAKTGAVTRLNQLLDWLGREEADGTIVFDESHKCKNLIDAASTQTARAVDELQAGCPGARIVYASATGASDARHLAFMSRLGLWGSGTAHVNYKGEILKFHDTEPAPAGRLHPATLTLFVSPPPFLSSSFLPSQAFEVAILGRRSGGFRKNDMMGRMEMVAIELKAIGMYCVRSLSWVGTEFDVVTVRPTVKQRKVYDDSAKMWQRLLVDINRALVRKKMNLYDDLDDGADVGDADMRDLRAKTKILKSQLWSAHQQFFRQMLLAMKAPTVGAMAREQIRQGFSPCISMWSTGESRTAEVMRRFAEDESLRGGCPEDFAGVSVAVEIVTRLLRWMVAPNGCALPLDSERYIRAFRSLELPLNPIEDIIEAVGGYSACAELTGRSDKLIRRRRRGAIGREPGPWRKVFKKRNWGTDNGEGRAVSIGELNMHEKELFMRGAKRAALITEAASNGISLHADKRAGNRSRRVMICTELPWAADKCLQQFGRVHRSNQRQAPRYILVVTDAAGESRFVAQIAQRLASMGALTRGDRRGCSGAFGSSEVFEKANYMDQVCARLVMAFEM